jgi:hypothetical protein
MEKAWEVNFTCGMLGLNKEDFLNDIESLTDNELLFVTSEVKEAYTAMKKEYLKRYNNGEA